MRMYAYECEWNLNTQCNDDSNSENEHVIQLGRSKKGHRNSLHIVKWNGDLGLCWGFRCPFWII